MTDTSGNVIRRQFLGGYEDVTLEDFIGSVVQDQQVACEIAFGMLEGDGYGSAEEGGFEFFEIIDREGLLHDLMRVSEDGYVR